jgi:hypothetical protein
MAMIGLKSDPGRLEERGFGRGQQLRRDGS